MADEQLKTYMDELAFKCGYKFGRDLGGAFIAMLRATIEQQAEAIVKAIE